MKLLQVFTLSKGFLRLYAVVAIVGFFVVLYFAWADVNKAKQYRQHLATGVQILAISKGYVLVGGGRQKFVKTGPRYVQVITGFATYLCLPKASLPQPVVSKEKKVYLNVSVKEYQDKTNASREYIDCKRSIFREADNAVMVSVAKAFSYSFLYVCGLYVLFLIVIPIVKWVVRGFE